MSMERYTSMRGVPYYNPRIKNTSYHYRYVGKKENDETRKARSILPRRSLIHRPFIPIMGIVNDLALKRCSRRISQRMRYYRSLQWQYQRW